MYLAPVPKTPGIEDAFYFVFFFSIDKVRKRPLKVTPMELRLLIWCQEIHMEHRVDVPLFWKSELVCNQSQHFGDGKGAVSFRG